MIKCSSNCHGDTCGDNEDDNDNYDNYLFIRVKYRIS